MSEVEKKSSLLLLGCAWLLVLGPLGWGVVQSVVKSLPLFEPHANAQPAPAAGAK
jgi:hypothetical protein